MLLLCKRVFRFLSQRYPVLFTFLVWITFSEYIFNIKFLYAVFLGTRRFWGLILGPIFWDNVIKISTVSTFYYIYSSTIKVLIELGIVNVNYELRFFVEFGSNFIAIYQLYKILVKKYFHHLLHSYK